MRPIKFRAWDKIGKRMLMNIEAGKLDKAYSEFSELSLKSILDFPDFEVMQFTGLYDKNGKEIYEGDILKYPTYDSSYCSVVEYKTDHCDGGITFCGYSVWDSSGREIVGNIYENPELLEISK